HVLGGEPESTSPEHALAPAAKRRTKMPLPVCELVNKWFSAGALGVSVDRDRGATDAERFCRDQPAVRRQPVTARKARAFRRGADREDRIRQPAGDAGLVYAAPDAGLSF